jgi:hypothetical protein
LLTRASLFAGDAVLLHHAVEVVAIDAREARGFGHVVLCALEQGEHVALLEGVAGGGASGASGHAAVPPSSVRNSRRFNGSRCIRSLGVLKPHTEQYRSRRDRSAAIADILPGHRQRTGRGRLFQMLNTINSTNPIPITSTARAKGSYSSQRGTMVPPCSNLFLSSG